MRLYDYAASGNCYKARLLLALLGQPYERVPVDIFAGDTLTDEYARVNPLPETPVLETDAGELIAQSNAILFYLADGTDYLPGDRAGRAQVLQWHFFEQERVMPGLGGTRFRRLTGRAAADPVGDARRFQLGLDTLAVLDAHLSGHEWLVGQRATIADLSVFAYTHVCGEASFELERFPAVVHWLERVRALPGFVDDLEPYPESAARQGAFDLRLRLKLSL
jgi:glutathione S-transferase